MAPNNEVGCLSSTGRAASLENTTTLVDRCHTSSFAYAAAIEALPRFANSTTVEVTCVTATLAWRTARFMAHLVRKPDEDTMRNSTFQARGGVVADPLQRRVGRPPCKWQDEALEQVWRAKQMDTKLAPATQAHYDPRSTAHRERVFRMSAARRFERAQEGSGLS